MKYLLITILLLGSLTTFSQTLSLNAATTRAVIIGISDYHDHEIPDLRFADKDATAFADFLQSKSGGNLPKDNIKILTNEKATTAQIAAALEWLVEFSKEDDTAIIYFSGHGDVETQTMFQLGYLLTWDSPARTYVAGAFPVSYLQAVVSTLSLKNKASVQLITDACRAGKLAGSSVGGAQVTNANLAKQFANEVKILSCQPDEFSIEGEQWGGGRGAFSFHLIDGLTGLADKNEDLQVNLFELEQYLEDKVPTETAPHNQIPMFVGSKNTRLALVDEPALANLKEQKAKERPFMMAIDTKVLEAGFLAQSDTTIQEMYDAFVAAIDSDHLLEPFEDSAYDLYQKLKDVPKLKDLRGSMTRNLAAALQDDAQLAINATLRSDPFELDDEFRNNEKYGLYTRYLEKAAEVLGAENFYYSSIKAKQFYFDGVTDMVKARHGFNYDSLYKSAIVKLNKAIEFEESGNYIYQRLGECYSNLFEHQKAIPNYLKVIELSPSWIKPYISLTYTYEELNRWNLGFEYLQKAIGIDSTNMEVQLSNARINSRWGHRSKGKKLYRNIQTQLQKMWEKDSVQFPTYYLCYWGESHLWLKEYEGAEKLFLKASKLTGHNQPYFLLGRLYQSKREFKKAVASFEKAIEKASGDWESHWYLGHIYKAQKEFKKAEAHYRKVMHLSAHNELPYTYISFMYSRNGQKDKIESLFLEAVNSYPDRPSPYIYLANHYLKRNRPDSPEAEKALRAKEKAQLEKVKPLLDKAIELNPDYHYAYLIMGKYFDRKRQYEEAIKMYKTAIQKLPSYSSAYNYMIASYLRLNKEKEALDAYWKMFDVGIDNSGELEYILADYLLKGADISKSYDLCHRSLDRALEGYSRFSVYKTYAYIFRKAEHPEEVVSMYEALIDKNLHRLEAMTELGYHYLKTKEFDQAKIQFDKVAEMSDLPMDQYFHYGCYYAQIGEPDKAIDYLEKAFENGYEKYIRLKYETSLRVLKGMDRFEALKKKYIR